MSDGQSNSDPNPSEIQASQDDASQAVVITAQDVNALARVNQFELLAELLASFGKSGAALVTLQKLFVSIGTLGGFAVVLAVLRNWTGLLRELRTIDLPAGTPEGVKARMNVLFGFLEVAAQVSPSPTDDAFVQALRVMFMQEEIVAFVAGLTDALLTGEPVDAAVERTFDALQASLPEHTPLPDEVVPEPA